MARDSERGYLGMLSVGCSYKELELFDRISRIYKSSKREYGLRSASKHCLL